MWKVLAEGLQIQPHDAYFLACCWLLMFSMALIFSCSGWIFLWVCLQGIWSPEHQTGICFCCSSVHSLCWLAECLSTSDYVLEVLRSKKIMSVTVNSNCIPSLTCFITLWEILDAEAISNGSLREQYLLNKLVKVQYFSTVLILHCQNPCKASSFVKLFSK